MSIRETLGRIESKATWIRDDTVGLLEYVNRLPAKRSFETTAEDALAVAEQELTTALERVKQARKSYSVKPVNDGVA